MRTDQIPDVFRGNGRNGRGPQRAQKPRPQAGDERPWVQLPTTCTMVLDVPDALLTEIVRTQAHAAAQRAQSSNRGVEQVPYAIRATMLVRRVPADGGEPERVCDLLMFISADASGRVSYEGTFGLFRHVMVTALEEHIARIANGSEDK